MKFFSWSPGKDWIDSFLIPALPDQEMRHPDLLRSGIGLDDLTPDQEWDRIFDS